MTSLKSFNFKPLSELKDLPFFKATTSRFSVNLFFKKKKKLVDSLLNVESVDQLFSGSMG